MNSIYSIIMVKPRLYSLVLFRSKSIQSTAPAEYCAGLVRKFDYENFICTLLLNSNTRSLAFAVRAFNIEVARVQDNVSDMKIGRMRLQFWLETIDSIFKNEVRDHPVVQELHRALLNHKSKELFKKNLKSLVTSRIEPITSSTFKTLEDMERYSELSVSPVHYMILQGAGMSNVHADHAASHLGKAQGLMNLMRSLPHAAKTRVLPLPQDLLIKHGLSQEKVIRGQGGGSLRDVVFDVASRAKQHLEKARSLKQNCPSGCATIFLPSICLDNYLTKLQLSEFDILDNRLQKRSAILPLRLYWNKLLGRF
ncbi:NADH dehydrogenase (ubiquinone) complex I, assembly factor 6 [Nilaparvata lugens]|uniref:NADH dehydrogenase (ubiquinone) complex I, assembly factor 6 n=1 Tax=Nilaparvata lugens TaxID=108931 RepID=UPI00193EA0B6|nr:NADH dehydrogenase (ubiquinone) complex I, assembly factor 6 [Nilaparvata lugens]